MSLQVRLAALITAIGTDIKALYANQGTLSSLTTDAKTSIVAAINEVEAEVAALAASAGASINDSATTGDTTQTYSANKIIALIAALKTEILGGASSAYDTLLEIQTALASEDSSISALLTAVGNRVSYDAAQSLTTAQKTQACANIGVGDPETDLSALYTTAKA